MEPELLDTLTARLIAGAVIGLIMGSFTTMLSYRVPRKLSIVTPPSQCPHCKTNRTKRDLVPVFSWLFGKGQCRHCRASIGMRYLVIEIVTMLAVMGAFVWLGINPPVIAAIVAIVAFVTMATINFEKRP